MSRVYLIPVTFRVSVMSVVGSLEFWQTQKLLGYSFTCALYQVAQKKAGTRVP
jgi:hypothetical protein